LNGAVIIIILGSSSLAMGVALMAGSVLASTRVTRRDDPALAGAQPVDSRVRPVVRMPEPEPEFQLEPITPRVATVLPPPEPVPVPERRAAPSQPSAASLAVTTSPAPRSRRVSLEILQEHDRPVRSMPAQGDQTQTPLPDSPIEDTPEPQSARPRVAILVGIRRVPLPGPHWRQHAVANTEEALQLLEKLPSDVIIVDYHHNPSEVLRRVAREYPHVSRLVRCDDEQAADLDRVVPEAQDIVLKHFSNDEFFELLERTTVMSLGELGERVTTALGPVSSLPALPANYQRIQRIIQDPNGSVRGVASIISQDIGLTTKVLQVINSPMYGTGSPVTDVGHAATLIGMRGIRDLALTIDVFGFFSTKLPMGGVTVEDIYEHSIRVAALAYRIGRIHAEDAYTAALLHQIGRLILMTRLPDPYQDAIEMHEATGVPLRDAQRHVIGIDQDETTAYVLNMWGLPQRVIEAVAFFDAPALVPHNSVDVVDILHTAVALIGEQEGDDSLPLDQTHLEFLGAAALIEDWREVAREICLPEDDPTEIDESPRVNNPTRV